jgi:plasmid stability protein
MAKSIQIRNVPDRVHLTLRSRASAAGESLSDYLLQELERIAERPSISEVLRRAQTRGGAGISTEEIVAAVRSGRDRDE